MMGCFQVTICLDIWIVTIVMTLVLITSALWFKSYNRCSPHAETVSLSKMDLSQRAHDKSGNFDSEHSLSEAQIYDLYSEFYAGMGEEDASNLDNYLERE